MCNLSSPFILRFHQHFRNILLPCEKAVHSNEQPLEEALLIAGPFPLPFHFCQQALPPFITLSNRMQVSCEPGLFNLALGLLQCLQRGLPPTVHFTTLHGAHSCWCTHKPRTQVCTPPGASQMPSPKAGRCQQLIEFL